MAAIFRLSLLCLIALLIPIATCTVDKAEQQERLSKHYQLKKPEGPGPFPAVMMVPGASGFDADLQKEYYNSVQKRLVESGFATLRVNSYASRNVTDALEGSVFPKDLANDIHIVLEYLLQQPFVKKGAINIIGWSWGGAAALLALSHAEDQEPIPVSAVVVYSPNCQYVQKWDSEVPVLVLGASLDNVCPFAQCERLFTSLPKRNKLAVKVYDGALHGFWNFRLPAKKGDTFAVSGGYHEAAAKSAWLEVIKFLRK